MKLPFLKFKFSNEDCLIEVSRIKEILKVESMVKTTAPGLNIMLYRNQNLPVIDLASAMSMGVLKQELKSSSRVLLLEKDPFLYGILVDSIDNIGEIETNDIVDPDAYRVRYVVGRIDNMIIFDPEAFLTKSMIDNFKIAYQFKLHAVDKEDFLCGKASIGKEAAINDIKDISTNIMIREINKGELDRKILYEAHKIYKLTKEIERAK